MNWNTRVGRRMMPTRGILGHFSMKKNIHREDLEELFRGNEKLISQNC